MKTFILGAAVTLLLGFGPAAAYDGEFLSDTPSRAFAGAKSFGGGADLSVTPSIKWGNKTPRASSPVMSYDEIIGGGHRTPSRVFH